MKRLTGLLVLLGAWVGAFPLTVRLELGTQKFAAAPKRIVALEYGYVDALAALGVRPVGAAIAPQGGDRGVPPYLREFVQGVAPTGSRAQPSLEAILALRPDLILADLTHHKDLYPQLQRIAPTVVWNSLGGDYDETLRQVLEIGRIVGKEPLARRLLADQASLLAKTRALAGRGLAPAIPAVAWAQGFTVQTSGVFTGELIERLGRANLGKPQGTQVRYELSLEGLAALDPPALVVFRAPDERVQLEEWLKSPLWANLQAVRANRVYVFDRDLWTRSRGLLAVRLMFRQALESGFVQGTAPAAAYALR